MRYCITGGTGSLGQELTRQLLAKASTTKVVVFSRDEYKQHLMDGSIRDERIRYYVGDVRDREALAMAMEGVDVVFLCHALKRVDQIEHNPWEALQTNTVGVQNAIWAARQLGKVSKVVLVSSDKACDPVNAYGLTKAMAERLMTSANYYRGSRATRFASVRYGNVLDSRGSVLWTWYRSILFRSKVKVTNAAMTRFHWTLAQAAAFVLECHFYTEGGEVFVPRLKAYIIGDLLAALGRVVDLPAEGEMIGMRPGEKLHEVLISRWEAPRTDLFEGFYRILPPEGMRSKYGLDYVVRGESPRAEVSSETAERLTIGELESDIRAALKRGEP